MTKDATRKMPKSQEVEGREMKLTYDNLLTQQSDTGPAWVDEMHRYYARHGRYRAADLNRLLGRPDGRTEGIAVLDFSRNGVAARK
jgi:hypothetical protein